MASVLQQYHQLADRMATQITGSYQSWTDFLTTAARLYKYPYHEQLKFAAMNLKKLATWRWNDQHHLLIFHTFFCEYAKNPVAA